MRFTTDGLVINEKVTGESTRLLTVLTRERGVIRAFANGARKMKGSTSAATDLLCYSSFTVSRSRDTYSISEATPLEVFFDLRSDIVKLSLAQYFCELASAIVPENVESEVYLRTLLNSLHFLCKGDKDVNLIKAITELRLISVAGFSPDLVACSVCGEYESGEMWLDVSEGQLYCDGCAHRRGAASVEVSAGILAAMRHIVYSPFDRLYSFTLSENGARELAKVSEIYLKNQTERRFNTLDFYHSLGV